MFDLLQKTLYPLGFTASALFGVRFILQWTESERKKQSISSPYFWKFSLAGNLIMLIHGFLQMQYLICFVQISNGLISLRNLQLLSTKPKERSSLTLFLYLTVSLGIMTGLYIAQSYFFDIPLQWFRVPVAPWERSKIIFTSPIFNLIGALGSLLFTARFWVQWAYSEKKKESIFNKGFWWLSIVGTALSLFYFLFIQDLVNIIGCLLGLVPYVRNLILLYKEPLLEVTPEEKAD